MVGRTTTVTTTQRQQHCMLFKHTYQDSSSIVPEGFGSTPLKNHFQSNSLTTQPYTIGNDLLTLSPRLSPIDSYFRHQVLQAG